MASHTLYVGLLALNSFVKFLGKLFIWFVLEVTIVVRIWSLIYLLYFEFPKSCWYSHCRDSFSYRMPYDIVFVLSRNFFKIKLCQDFESQFVWNRYWRIFYISIYVFSWTLIIWYWIKIYWISLKQLVGVYSVSLNLFIFLGSTLV